MKHHFKHIESYKHLYAKEVLTKWLQPYYIVEQEYKFYDNGLILFTVDIACFRYSKIREIYEICHKNSMSAKKLAMIHYWQYTNGQRFCIYEVEAETILQQIQKPKYLKKIDYTL
jgi:hypothetical protein